MNSGHIKLYFLCVLIALVGKDNIIAQAYQIPGADIQPAWVFPIFIQNGDGQVDTLFFSIDDDATFFNDPQFGEAIEYPLPDTVFAVCWGDCRIDHPFSFTVPFIDGFLASFGAINVVPPLTIWIDNDLLYSDSLPYSSVPNVPKIKMVLVPKAFSPQCPDLGFLEELAVFADTFANEHYCKVHDSLVISIPDGVPFVTFELWNDPLTGIGQSAHGSLDDCISTVGNTLTVRARCLNQLSGFKIVEVYDMLGKCVLCETFSINRIFTTDLTVDLSKFTDQLLVVSIGDRSRRASTNIYVR